MFKINVNMGHSGRIGSRKISGFLRALPVQRRKGLNQAGAVIARKAKQLHASGRPYPIVRTGTLLRSIDWELIDNGTGVLIGPGGFASAYAAALEFGHPRWPAGVKYPYMGPAAQMSMNDALDALQAALVEPLDK